MKLLKRYRTALFLLFLGGLIIGINALAAIKSYNWESAGKVLCIFGLGLGLLRGFQQFQQSKPRSKKSK